MKTFKKNPKMRVAERRDELIPDVSSWPGGSEAAGQNNSLNGRGIQFSFAAPQKLMPSKKQ